MQKTTKKLERKKPSDAEQIQRDAKQIRGDARDHKHVKWQQIQSVCKRRRDEITRRRRFVVCGGVREEPPAPRRTWHPQSRCSAQHRDSWERPALLTQWSEGQNNSNNAETSLVYRKTPHGTFNLGGRCAVQILRSDGLAVCSRPHDGRQNIPEAGFIPACALCAVFLTL